MTPAGPPSLEVRIRRRLAPVARAVVGTRLEAVAYGAWNLFTRGSWPEAATEYDRLTVSVMRRVLRRDSNSIDVGAHRGTILRHLVTIAPEGHHVAVEPLPSFAAGLRRRFPDVEVLEMALADERGEATFHHVVTNPSYSGLARRWTPHRDDVVDQIVVRVERLDDVIPADLPVHLVKIDVEGGELGVLQGGRSLLRRWHPVMVFEHGWDGRPSAPDDSSDLLFQELDADGYAVYQLAAWLEDGSPLTHEGFIDALGRGGYYFLAAPRR